LVIAAEIFSGCPGIGQPGLTSVQPIYLARTPDNAVAVQSGPI